jgi:hypothetical protein
MFCHKCGSQIADNAAFCHKCGKTITWETNSSIITEHEAESTTESTSTILTREYTSASVPKKKGISRWGIASIVIATISLFIDPGVFAVLTAIFAIICGVIGFTSHKSRWPQILGLVIGVLAFVGGLPSSDNNAITDNTTATAKANGLTVDGIFYEYLNVSDAAADYNSNKLSAKQKYAGYSYVVTGTISDIRQEFFGSRYLVILTFPGTSMEIHLLDLSSNDIMSLKKGQKIKVIGTLEGFYEGIPDKYIDFKYCQLLK